MSFLTKNKLHKRLIEVAAMSPAKKRKVGAIIAIVEPHPTIANEDVYSVIAEGYNFNLSGGPCETEDGNTHPNVIHAEAACINNLPEDFDQVHCKMFVTHPPCDGCKAAILAENLTYEVMGDFLKFDSDKPRMSLVPPSLNIEVAKVLTYGAKKYKPDNWRKVKSRERYIDALERHLADYKAGIENDDESGLLHLSHMATNIAFLIELKDLPLREGEE